MSRILPMFPLGSVLVPTALLPLHVFEERYRAMVHDVLAGDREFGVVLIDRGRDVGGGDVRSHLGTIARVVEARELDDGRWVLIGAGTRRIRVEEWLEDDPYPRALVEELDDVPGEDSPAARDAAVTVLRRVLALAAELGGEGPPATVDVADEPIRASFEALALAPIGPLDRHRLLGAADAATRLRGLAALLDELEGDLRAQVALHDDGALGDITAFLAEAAEEAAGADDDSSPASPTDGEADDRDDPDDPDDPDDGHDEAGS